MCLQGRLDVIFYTEVPHIDVGWPGRDLYEMIVLSCACERAVWCTIILCGIL